MNKISFLVILEHEGEGFSAYCPDLPGCVAAGDTQEETLRLIREAIPLHLQGLIEDGIEIPQPTTKAEYYSYDMTA